MYNIHVHCSVPWIQIYVAVDQVLLRDLSFPPPGNASYFPFFAALWLPH